MAVGLFITGTNTEVGKTYVTALIAKSLLARGKKVGVYKPVASGCVQQGDQLLAEDAVALWEAAGKPLSLEAVCPQKFAAPLAPHLAAREQGQRVDQNLLRTGLRPWLDDFDIVLVEGVGGLMSPISDEDYVADLALEFQFPLVVVAPNQLGTINATLQTLVTASTLCDGLSIAGVVLNDRIVDAADPSQQSNLAELQQRCVPPILAEVGYNDTDFSQEVDWYRLAGNGRKEP